jgi:hypothetical protein
MGTTLEEFKAMGVDTESKEFLAGMKYGRKLNKNKFLSCAGFIRYWAQMNAKKIREVKDAA